MMSSLQHPGMPDSRSLAQQPCTMAGSVSQRDAPLDSWRRGSSKAGWLLQTSEGDRRWVSIGWVSTHLSFNLLLLYSLSSHLSLLYSVLQPCRVPSTSTSLRLLSAPRSRHSTAHSSSMQTISSPRRSVAVHTVLSSQQSIALRAPAALSRRSARLTPRFVPAQPTPWNIQLLTGCTENPDQTRAA